MRETDGTGPVLFRSACPVASTLDILGDKWTMVIIRDLFTGARRYGDFLAGPEGITTNILADRLKHLETEGIVDRVPYQQRPERFEYRLTDKGKALQPVLQALKDWNLAWIPDRAARVRPARPEAPGPLRH